MRRLLGPLCFAALLTGCVEQAPALDYGDPTAIGQQSEVDGIVASIVSPRVGQAIASPQLAVEVAAHATGEPASLRVRIGNKSGGLVEATARGPAGPGQTFAASVPLVHGANIVRVLVEDEAQTRFRRLDFEVLYDGAAPGLTVAALAPAPGRSDCEGATPIEGLPTAATAVCLRGVVTTAAGAKPQGVRVASGAATLAADGSFEGLVPLAADQAQAIEVVATDDRGRSTSGLVAITQDSLPPALALTAPGGGPALETDDDAIVLGGTADDANGLDSIRIEASGGGAQVLGPASPWQVTVPLAPGDNALTVAAIDRAGNRAELPVTVRRNRVIRLAAPSGGPAAAKLSLDRQALSSLLDAEDQKKIKAAVVPLRPAIKGALAAIREPEKNGIDVSTWGQPERNLSRLLATSPDNADLHGTSIEELLSLGAAVGLPPGRLLSDLLGVSVLTPFLTTDTLTDVLLENTVATHPNATLDAQGEPVLEVTLYDVFQDLSTIGPRFGPAGEHPGFLEGATRGSVLESGFRMGLPVKTNLRQYDGVDASGDTLASLFRLEGDSVLELDFTSNDFTVVGLADEPSIDMRVRVREDAAFIGAGATQKARPDAASPGFYRGDGAVWDRAPWLIERLVADGTYRQYARAYAGDGYQKTLSYDAGSIKQAATLTWDKGWVTIATSGGIGSPPPPQYIWDMILEVAQVRLHDGIAEGEADMAFDLQRIPVGLTADDLVKQLRPTLQAQAGELSKLLAGNAGLAASKADFFFVPSSQAGAQGFLFFRAPGDDAAPYAYATPGFFSDAALTKKASSTGALGGTTDATHEKIAAQAGLVVYVADDAKAVFKVEVIESTAAGAAVRVSRQGGGS